MTSSTSASADLRVVVGRIGRAHGLRGEVGVEVRTDEPELRFAPGAVLFARVGVGAESPAGGSELRVAAVKWHSGRLLIAFDGISDRTGAEGLRGLLLEVDADPAQLPAEPDEFYDHQLTGLIALGDDGGKWGEVTEVVHVPGQDLLVVTRADGTEVMVPFVAAFVAEVDLTGGSVLLRPPEGLFS